MGHQGRVWVIKVGGGSSSSSMVGEEQSGLHHSTDEVIGSSTGEHYLSKLFTTYCVVTVSVSTHEKSTNFNSVI